MIDVRTSAPGKVLIAGEYAVLDGAPAICMAVNRRAHVSISAGDKDYHSISAPGFSETATEFPLLDAVWQELQFEAPGFVNIVLDSSEFIAGEAGKIGIGSSAALTVALTAALHRVAGHKASIRDDAMAAHRRFQGGAGSGVDIACSLAGGIIQYRVDEHSDRSQQWPAGLNYALLWSGVAADTSEQLRKLSGIDARATRAELCGAAQRVAQAWNECDSAEIVVVLRAYASALQRFDVDHQLGIFDAGHAELVAAATSPGIVYKPCGAGGGDLGIVIGVDASEVAAFVETASKQGFKSVDLDIDATGLIFHSDSQ